MTATRKIGPQRAQKKSGPEGPRGFVDVDGHYMRGSPCSFTVMVAPGEAASCVR